MYLDSNIFISPLVYEGSRKAANAKRILGMVERGDMVGYTSTQTWDEIVWVVRKLLGKADSVQAGEKCHQAPRGPKGVDSRGLGENLSRRENKWLTIFQNAARGNQKA